MKLELLKLFQKNNSFAHSESALLLLIRVLCLSLGLESSVYT
jgi:hypothetical protein